MECILFTVSGVIQGTCWFSECMMGLYDIMGLVYFWLLCHREILGEDFRPNGRETKEI